MNYFYILFLFVVWGISQTIKFFIRLMRKEVPIQLRGLLWTYIWAEGSPSTHTAILASSLFLLWHSVGFSPVFTFCFAITLLWLYDMAASHKRQELMNEYFIHDGSETLKKIVSDGYALDLAGHTAQEIAWGAALGIALGAIAVYAIFPGSLG